MCSGAWSRSTGWNCSRHRDIDPGRDCHPTVIAPAGTGIWLAQRGWVSTVQASPCRSSAPTSDPTGGRTGGVVNATDAPVVEGVRSVIWPGLQNRLGGRRVARFRPGGWSPCPARVQAAFADHPSLAALADPHTGRHGPVGAGLVPALGGARGGQNAAGVGAGSTRAGLRGGWIRPGCLPDGAADPAVGAGREPAGHRARGGRLLAAAAEGLSWRGGDLCADRQGAGPMGARGETADVGDRR
jgi:hypothetical protein